MNYLRVNNLQLQPLEGIGRGLRGHERQIIVQEEFANESDDEMGIGESDVEFEDQLEKFKERLDHISKEATKKKAKLVPNVSKDWIRELQKILDNQYGFVSPKSGSSQFLPSQRDLLWLSKQQNSA